MANVEVSDDPCVADFLESVCGDERFAAELDEWCDARCMVFKGHTLEGEHSIDFTDLHMQYVAAWEAKLEAFLAERGLQAQDLASRLLRFRRRQRLGAKWVPSFVSDCEYENFFENMVARAETDGMEAAARCQEQVASPSADDVNLSGVFKLDLSRTTSVAEIDRVSKLGGVPFTFRKLYCQVVGRTRVVVNHSRDTVQLQLKIPFFSSKVETYVHDGVQREGIAPISGGHRLIKSWREGDVFRTTFQVKPESLECADVVDVYYEQNTRDVICLRQLTYFSNGEVGEIIYGFVRQ